MNLSALEPSLNSQPLSVSSDSRALVSVENLETTFYLKSGPFRAVNNISYEINKGETLGIVGESGCGKSVTSFSLMRLIERPGKITRGRFLLGGRDVLSAPESQMEEIRGGDMAMIFQEPMTALNPVLTIGFQIDEQIIKHKKCSPKEARERSIEMLKLVGIPSPESRYTNYPHQLSGGMRQRAMIAMALSCDPKFLIADEPTTALDVTIQAQILELIQKLQSQFHMSVQFITHDLGVISEVSDKVLVMYGGQMCEKAPTQTLFTSPKHPYTAALIESRPKLGQRSARLKTIEGSVPAPHELPAGCPFVNRCMRAKSECSHQKPMPTMVAPDHSVACFNPL
ncbi:MAG: ABC transporter ATP-binding protein [Bdellovibrionaceae bacterium]|jgi:oligopeptide/dipeptide ABC transporter ATP-binding protein|nr:ABC transporter ATP-binding protein [Pseudobdellovibrionaceae bacterium]